MHAGAHAKCSSVVSSSVGFGTSASTVYTVHAMVTNSSLRTKEAMVKGRKRKKSTQVLSVVVIGQSRPVLPRNHQCWIPYSSHDDRYTIMCNSLSVSDHSSTKGDEWTEGRIVRFLYRTTALLSWFIALTTHPLSIHNTLLL